MAAMTTTTATAMTTHSHTPSPPDEPVLLATFAPSALETAAAPPGTAAPVAVPAADAASAWERTNLDECKPRVRMMLSCTAF